MLRSKVLSRSVGSNAPRISPPVPAVGSVGGASSTSGCTGLSPSSFLGGRLVPVGRRLPQPCRVLEPRDGKDYGDRIVAAVPYLLPMLDGLQFGKFIFFQYPFIARALSPLAPLAMIYNSFPFASLIAFFAVYSGMVSNQNFSRFVRYNALQAVLLDVLIIVPQILLTNVFHAPTDDELGFAVWVGCFNTVFLFVAISVAYGMGSSLVGQTARLPIVAEAADSQLRGRGGPDSW